MPIDIDRFEGTHPEKLRSDGPTNAESVLKFLAANPEQAFTPKEIHESTDVARGSVGVVLSRLEKRELVRHRGEYWALADDAEPQKTITSMTTARAATDRLGPENPDDWGAGVEADENDTDENT